MEGGYSRVTIRETQEKKRVKIGSEHKPKIIPGIIKKWQSLINSAADITNVPSALIMQLNEENIEVFLRSVTEGNPYEPGEQAPLIYGLYCETVIGTQDKLIVPDATKSKVWKNNNPDIDLNMISYLGYPVNWPDGEVFGTVCLLDSKENPYGNKYVEFLSTVKDHIESDLQILFSNQLLEDTNKELSNLNAIKSKFLSLISHDIRGGIGSLNEFLRLMIEDIEEYDNLVISKMLNIVKQKANSTYHTLEDLLNWSKNDLAELLPQKSRIDLVELINNLLDYFTQTISLKKINLIKEFNEDHIYLNADKNMLESSFRNIISNAIKYSNKNGKIIVRIAVEQGKTKIEIEDFGIGMGEKTLSNLFNYDESHQKEGTEGEKSAGIGLLIIKDFLDKNGAEVKVESELGKGTKFIVTL